MINYKNLGLLLAALILLLQSCGNPGTKLHLDELPDKSKHGSSSQVDFLTRQTQSSSSISSHVTAVAPSGTVFSVRCCATSERVSNSPISFKQPISKATVAMVQAPSETVVSRSLVSQVSGPMMGTTAPAIMPRCLRFSETRALSYSSPQAPAITFYSPFRLRSGVVVTFSQLGSRWLAEVNNEFLRHQETLPVICRGDVASVLLDLQGAREIDVLKRIHFLGADQGTKHVYVGTLGLRGGGKKKQKKKHGKNKPKKPTDEDTLESTPDSEFLDAKSISPRLLSMVAAAKNPTQAVFSALENLREYYNDNGFDSSGIDKWSNYNKGVKSINNRALDQIWEYCQGGEQANIDEDGLFLTLLESSNSYLGRRTKSIEDWINVKNSARTPIPTCHYLFRIAYEGKDPGKVNRLRLAQERIQQRFQLINSVITLLFHAKLAKIAEGDEAVALTEENKQLIERAKYLHPLLAGGDFIGHVDDFIPSLSGVSSLLQALYPNSDTDIDPIFLFNSILSIKKVRSWIKRYQSSHSKNNSGEYDYDPEHPSVPILQCYAEDMPSEKRKEMLKKKAQNVPTHDIIIYIVQFPKEKVLSDEFARYFGANDGVETQDGEWLPAFLKAFKQSQQLPEFVENGSLLEHQAASLTIDEQEDTTSDSHDLKTEYLVVAPPPVESTLSSKREHIDRRVKEALPTVQPLTNTAQKTYDKLFDMNYKVSSKITYNEYEQLWNSLGGSIGNQVGSHLQLLDKDRHAVGTIVKLHGSKDLRYGRRAIRELRNMVFELSRRQDPLK